MMRIEVTTEAGIRHGTLDLSRGDVVTVSDDLGRYFVERMGWARDVASKVKQPARRTLRMSRSKRPTSKVAPREASDATEDDDTT